MSFRPAARQFFERRAAPPPPLPYDAEVEYLESTGTQWIQLGFGFDPSDEIEASFSIDTSEKNDKYMNAAQTWNSGRTFGMGVAGGGKLTMAFGNASSTSTVLVPVTINDGAFHTWKYDNRVCSVTDLSVSYDMTGLSFTTTTNLLRLFFGYNAPTKGKIAYYKHKKNGVLMCALYSVRFTNELGQDEGAMFDKVSGLFFRNAGTGSFVIGPEV